MPRKKEKNHHGSGFVVVLLLCFLVLSCLCFLASLLVLQSNSELHLVLSRHTLAGKSLTFAICALLFLWMESWGKPRENNSVYYINPNYLALLLWQAKGKFVSKQLSLTANGKKFTFNITPDAFDRYLNEIQLDKKTVPAHNFLMRTVAKEDKQELLEFLRTPSAGLLLCTALIEAYSPAIEIEMGESSEGQES